MVMVGREGNDLKLRFSPDQVFADVGDRVQFQFYPLVCWLILFLELSLLTAVCIMVGFMLMTDECVESLGGTGGL